MKNTLRLILILLFTWSSSLFAQQRGPSNQGLVQFAIQHAEELNLTQDQKTALAELQITMRTERQEMGRRGSSGNVGRQQGSTVRAPQQRGNQRSDQGFGRQRPEQNVQGRQGDRRVDNRADAVPVTERDRTTRFEMMQELREAVHSILTEDQVEKIQTLQSERRASLSEFRALRQQIAIERAELEPAKAERVTALMDQMNQQRDALHALRFESAGAPDIEKMRLIQEEMRTIQEQLRDELTVNEFRALQQAGFGNQQGNRNNGRGQMRNRQQ